ncbi:MAG: 1-(5-phosphoribosyl)-5-[(5-phosphoribosylamino)methylideneamino] imidazole-4-carboxamide isomerase [Chroococcidiopsis cubana SAG 39.79]|uniref:1-(5-phosphoribosyl)-5-[(5-phosphoribosylamino)methylideneamino] imidazole-4-carboxamide isomerase n=1 Tax=Chroococcidiopsis cubana SAG 39.79 TaxID=388085 RepID=A0AB37UB22_9CYAN|nr:1-(5-phosphoribosyl)-5-[(5-phosphoribosylamino)methylideneamino]imidazole-4-carboxamide isomerase [Chroococcidiopsis cubana]MDZ4875143.1 1-(5-phosphoribosyl)-5-[(5-phosphoribosylamino)methylideneamino] imidazole-4-carboxamide isomerase [Chroococcidiopsis cubana SAG 39.79]PSB65402.1 1-(5-phosphoribosyl)-5-((5-phosphoribosylamino)methylideneamino)imidazole-4-carboxamide isomerase [Chroococcidiopsis cubana CCALA 043]RUT03768.1 1-(5-phosphoribosyl)-5-[(5-phosphoribosylamino)methylideneamino] imid
MNLFPAIDLLEGRCVRLYQGDYDRSQVFHDNPADVAQQWTSQGATWLHVVDLDGAKAGKPANLEAIAAIVEAVSVPIQVGGGLRDRASVAQLLELGVQRVILGTVAVEQPQLVASLCQEFPGRIVVGIDARNGKVATRGWLETSEVLAADLAQQMQQLGAAAIIYTDIHRDGTLAGPNLDALRELATSLSIPVIASGGVSSVTDLLSLLALEPLGVTGAIVGRALYTGDISLTQAIQAVGQGRWQDIPPDLGSSAFA